MSRPFIFFSEYGELLDLAMHLKNQGESVYYHIQDDYFNKIGDGIIEKVKDWYRYMGKGYVWVFDSCNNGDFQDWLREKGELVCGGNKEGDELENNRQKNQKLFKEAGFHQTFSRNFKDIDSTIQFIIQHPQNKYILKQNGDAPKSINYMAKMDNNLDLIYHLQGLKEKWNKSEYGEFDCDLMEIVEGLEVAGSAFFNGKDFLRDKNGLIAGFINFEEKKESDGDRGETTGETGTTFYGCNEENKLFREIICRPKIIEYLRKINFKGVFDINGSLMDKGYTAFEPTCRFGIPASSYEFIEAMDNPAEIIEAMASGKNAVLKINQGWGMVIVISAKPFPAESNDLKPELTSIDEKLWILKNKKPQKDFDAEQKKHIHLSNFYKENNDYKVATKSGHLLTVTGKGSSIKSVRDNLLNYIKDNIYISGMKWRTDIGQRVEKQKL